VNVTGSVSSLMTGFCTSGELLLNGISCCETYGTMQKRILCDTASLEVKPLIKVGRAFNET
jgi:hypothetical protein